jgi:hypothetical protein
MTPPPLSRGKGGSSDDEFMNSPPKSPKKDASGGGMGSSPTLPKISEDAAVSSEKNSREMYASVTPQFALNSPMEASIAPTEKILKAELMEEFLTNKQQDNNSASTTETPLHATIATTKEEQQQQQLQQQQQQQQGAGMPQTTSNTGQNSSDNSDDDTSYHGRRKNFLFSKDDGNALTNEQRQIRRLLQLGYFLLHAAVIATLVLAVVWNSRLFGFISITLGGSTVINFVVTGLQAIFLEPSTHVVGKRLYFILNGVQKEFVNLLHGVLCLCCWSYYVQMEDMVNKSDLKEYWYLTTY